MWVRIHQRFGPRMSEWFMGVHMLLFGIVLLTPSETFVQPAFWAFRHLVPGHPEWSEPVLGWIMFFAGLARLGGLIVNGARAHVTPQIRQASAAIGCLIWVGISYGFFSSDVISTWVAVYPVFVVKEIINFHRAAVDEGEARNGKAH